MRDPAAPRSCFLLLERIFPCRPQIIDAAVAKALKAKGCGCDKDKDKDKDKPKPPSTFNSFGIVSGVKAPKSNSLTAYKGKSPSGPNGKQYTKAVSTGKSQRPGGYTVCVYMCGYACV
jgi:hypothetical protein